MTILFCMCVLHLCSEHCTLRMTCFDDSFLQVSKPTAFSQPGCRSSGSTSEKMVDWWSSSKPTPNSEVASIVHFPVPDVRGSLYNKLCLGLILPLFSVHQASLSLSTILYRATSPTWCPPTTSEASSLTSSCCGALRVLTLHISCGGPPAPTAGQSMKTVPVVASSVHSVQ